MRETYIPEQIALEIFNKTANYEDKSVTLPDGNHPKYWNFEIPLFY